MNFSLEKKKHSSIEEDENQLKTITYNDKNIKNLNQILKIL